jgi:nucleoside-diphosphate-sugar epimerase
VIPAIMTQLAVGAREVKVGELNATRDFTYVEDTCRGLLSIAQMEGGIGDVFNIGSNLEIAIGELVALIGEVMGVRANAVADPERFRPATSEVMRLRCDNTKLERASAFRPSVPLAEGLARTAEWFRDPVNLRRYKTDLYSV